MEHDVRRHPEASPPPCAGQREMHVSGQGVRQLVERERRLVRYDSLPLRPEPGGDQFLVLARGEVHEPVDPTAKSQGLPAVDVVHQELWRVPCLGRLLGRE